MSDDSPKFEHPQQQSSQPAYGQVFTAAPNLSDLIENVANLKQDFQNYKNQRINFNTDIIGLFETVSAAPTLVPVSPYDQIKIYVNGATLRLYWYDAIANVWHYVTATS